MGIGKGTRFNPSPAARPIVARDAGGGRPRPRVRSKNFHERLVTVCFAFDRATGPPGLHLLARRRTSGSSGFLNWLRAFLSCRPRRAGNGKARAAYRHRRARIEWCSLLRFQMKFKRNALCTQHPSYTISCQSDFPYKSVVNDTRQL